MLHKRRQEYTSTLFHLTQGIFYMTVNFSWTASNLMRFTFVQLFRITFALSEMIENSLEQYEL